ncbi:MAG: hypothetical protein KC546_07245 [Anaerolineae bacterium]|nr:hypothetical protein [Anaerolineae bacterium]MCA9892258.1 hypothetical protein [Anaerolineae bacterium]
MNIPIIFAHGALGSFDEIIFVSVILLFLVLMVMSWVRSRNLPDEEETTAVIEDQQTAPMDSDHFALK